MIIIRKNQSHLKQCTKHDNYWFSMIVYHLMVNALSKFNQVKTQFASPHIHRATLKSCSPKFDSFLDRIQGKLNELLDVIYSVSWLITYKVLVFKKAGCDRWVWLSTEISTFTNFPCSPPFPPNDTISWLGEKKKKFLCWASIGRL